MELIHGLARNRNQGMYCRMALPRDEENFRRLQSFWSNVLIGVSGCLNALHSDIIIGETVVLNTRETLLSEQAKLGRLEPMRSLVR